MPARTYDGRQTISLQQSLTARRFPRLISRQTRRADRASSVLPDSPGRPRDGERQASPRISKERRSSYPRSCRTSELRRSGRASGGGTACHSLCHSLAKAIDSLEFSGRLAATARRRRFQRFGGGDSRPVSQLRNFMLVPKIALKLRRDAGCPDRRHDRRMHRCIDQSNGLV